MFKHKGTDSRPDCSHKMCSVDKNYCRDARPAFTRLLVLQKGYYNGYPATRVMLKPQTGRRHQLRVHCSLLGHTIVGDYTYSNRTDVTPYRMFLHAFRLILPTSLETIDVSADDPFFEGDNCNTKAPWVEVETINVLSHVNTFEKLDTQQPDLIVKHSFALSPQ